MSYFSIRQVNAII
uniref:Uncharacterized protein n=1 Tax=Arundo donax TaxID=35708 RepID=A0A0A9FY20_ARUDO